MCRATSTGPRPLAVVRPSPAAAAAAVSLRSASVESRTQHTPMEVGGIWGAADRGPARRCKHDLDHWLRLVIITPKPSLLDIIVPVDSTVADLRQHLTEAGLVGGLPE